MQANATPQGVRLDLTRREYVNCFVRPTDPEDGHRAVEAVDWALIEAEVVCPFDLTVYVDGEEAWSRTIGYNYPGWDAFDAWATAREERALERGDN